MNYFFLNVFLAGAWMLINGEYTGLNFVVGFYRWLFCVEAKSAFWTEIDVFHPLRCGD